MALTCPTNLWCRVTAIGRPLAAALCCAVALWGGTPVVAQPADPQSPADAAPALTEAEVQQRLDRLLANPQLADDTRDQAQAFYQTALERLDVQAGSVESEQRYRQSAAESEQVLARLGRELWESAGTPLASLLPASDAGVPELEQALAAAQGRASSLRTTLSDLEAQLQSMAGRAAPLREELAAEHQKLADLAREREQVPEGEEPAALRQARETALEARRLARVARIASLEQELASLPARQEIAQARRKIVQVRLTRIDEVVRRVTERVASLELAEAAQDLARSEEQARAMAGELPLLSSYARETAELNRAHSDTLALVGQSSRQQLRAEERWETFVETRESLEQVLEIGAAGEDFAELLRELQERLPGTAPIRQQLVEREEAIINARLQRLRMQERRRRLQDPAEGLAYVIDQARQVDIDLRLTEREQAELTTLIARRVEVLGRLEAAYTTYIDRLTELNRLDAELVLEADELSDLLDEKLLWLPSAAPLGRPWLGRVGMGVGWLFTPAYWADAGQQVRSRALAKPLATPGVFLAVLVLLAGKRRMGRRLARIAEAAGSASTDSFLLTLRATGLCFLLALPISLLLFWVGWLLYTASGGLFVYGLGGGLMNAGIVLYILRVFQVMSRKHSLFQAHFRWSDRSRRVLATNLGWLIPVILPIAVVVPMTELSGDIVYRNGLGRLSFLIASGALSWFMYRLLHPRRGAVAGHLPERGLVWRTRLVWFPVFAAAPALLGLLAAAGYYVTALKIQGQLFTTAWVSLVGLIVYALALRWVMVAHRRLAIKRARQQREKLLAEQAAKAEHVEAGEAVPQSTENQPMDLSAVSSQTRALIRAVVGSAYLFLLYLIWRDLVPALGALDNVALWSSTESTPEGDVVSSITLWGLILTSVILALTFVAARNLPGLLEIVALQRLSVDTGTRYAAVAIARYIIIAVGLVVAFDKVGVGWGQMQFVVAALGVGLGFGLQEIVANFVSGIIILFERPIRVGDAVTVNELSGTVARIQIRATTIVDWDNREILVPNKSFITDRVINWTLTDPITRMVFTVGVAYGTDTDKAYNILNDLVKQNPMVLDQPAPTVFFVGLGESSLDFDVRVFVKDHGHRMPVRHDLLMAIEKAFADAGIEIPFPQRDLHLRSSDIPGLGGKAAGPDVPSSD